VSRPEPISLMTRTSNGLREVVAEGLAASLFRTRDAGPWNDLPPALRQQLSPPSFGELKRFMYISAASRPARVTIDQDAKFPISGP
jgi:hypothetical protein